MTETAEKKLTPVNWIRVDVSSYPTYERAQEVKESLDETRILHEQAGKLKVNGRPYRHTDGRSKIVARSDGTFDVIGYITREAWEDTKRQSKAPAKAEEKVPAATEEKVHGLRAKERRKQEK